MDRPSTPPAPKTTPPFNNPFKPEITEAGRALRLARVRFWDLPLSSRKLSRNSTAGGELLLGTVSMNTRESNHDPAKLARAYMDTNSNNIGPLLSQALCSK